MPKQKYVSTISRSRFGLIWNLGGSSTRWENNSPGSSQNMTPELSPSMQYWCKIAWLYISASQSVKHACQTDSVKQACQTSKSVTLHRSVSSTISSIPNEILCSVPDLELDWSCLTLSSVSFELSFLWVASSLSSDTSNLVESCAKGGSGFRFVVNLNEMTCSCRAWQRSGISCKYAIAYITSIPGAKLEDHVNDYFSVQKFKAAYEDRVPSIPDKSVWSKATHGCFMHPPLLKSTAGGRRKNRMKSAMEGGSTRKTLVEGASTRKKHECSIAQYVMREGTTGTPVRMRIQKIQLQ